MGVFFLASTGAGAEGFFDLVGDEDFGLTGSATAFGRTGICWSSVNRTCPLSGFGEAACRVCVAAKRTTSVNKHSRWPAIILELPWYTSVCGPSVCVYGTSYSPSGARLVFGETFCGPVDSCVRVCVMCTPADSIRRGPVSRSRMRFYIYIARRRRIRPPLLHAGRDLNLVGRATFGTDSPAAVPARVLIT